MFIDTHCHLTDAYCDGVDNNEIINRAVDAGVKVMICPTADPKDIEAALKLARAHNNIFCTIGIHPECASTPPTTAPRGAAGPACRNRSS